MWGETTRVENRGETTRGETTRGGNVLGAKRLVTEEMAGAKRHETFPVTRSTKYRLPNSVQPINFRF